MGGCFCAKSRGCSGSWTVARLLPTPVLDIAAKVDSWNERGLLSVCFDPQFARNGWIYVYYTHNRNPARCQAHFQQQPRQPLHR